MIDIISHFQPLANILHQWMCWLMNYKKIQSRKVKDMIIKNSVYTNKKNKNNKKYRKGVLKISKAFLKRYYWINHSLINS